MLNEVVCPKCKAKLRSNNDLTGKTVRCSKCQERFVASADVAPPPVSQGDTQMLSAMEIAAMKPKAAPVKSALEAMDDLPVLDPMPAAKPVAKAVPKVVAAPAPAEIPAPPAPANAFAFDEVAEKPRKRKPADDEDDEDEDPRPRKKTRSDDDDEDQDTVVDEAAPASTGAFAFDEAPEPASKKKSKRRLDDEEDDDRPRKVKGKPAKKGPPVLLLAGVAVGFFVLAGGGVAAYLLLGKKSVAKAPTSAAAKAPVEVADAKPTKPGTKATAGVEPPPATKPEKPDTPPPPKGKGPKVNPKTPAAGGPKSNLPKAPAADPMLVSAIKEKFTIDAAPESIKAFRIVGEGPDRKIFIARNSFAGFQGQGALDTIDRYAIDSGAKIGSCEVKADGVKWPRPFEPSPDGKHILIEGPVGRFSLFSFEENKYLIQGEDPFAGKANRKGPLKGLNWKGNDAFHVSDHNGSTDEWSVATRKLKKAGPNLPDADAEAKVVVHPLDDGGELLAVLRDSQFYILQQGASKGPGSLPEASAVPIALAGSTLANRIKMAVVAQIKDTTQFMVYILNFSDADKPPLAIRLPEGIGPVTGIGWQSIDSIVVTIEGGAAALVIDLEEEYPIAYVKSPAAKAQIFGKATFNSLWYAVADPAGKTQVGGINLDFDGYKKMAEDAKGNKSPVYIVPGEKGIAK
jgi:hypothetical protein